MQGEQALIFCLPSPLVYVAGTGTRLRKGSMFKELVVEEPWRKHT